MVSDREQNAEYRAVFPHRFRWRKRGEGGWKVESMRIRAVSKKRKEKKEEKKKKKRSREGCGKGVGRNGRRSKEKGIKQRPHKSGAPRARGRVNAAVRNSARANNLVKELYEKYSRMMDETF